MRHIKMYCLLFISIFVVASPVLAARNKQHPEEPIRIYIVPHFHWDLSYKQSEDMYEKMGNGLILEFLEKAKSDPDFKFILDQVPLMEKFLEWKPDRVEQMKHLIEEGRLEITGAMYAQPDVNLPSGESLIRQILYGQRWIEKNLGTRAKYLWNIDSFGRLYTIPQVAAGAGLEAVVWSAERTNINLPDKQVYQWKSPDGSVIRSQVLYPHYNACEKLGRSNPYEWRREWQLAEEFISTLRTHDERKNYIALCGSDFMPPAPSLTNLANDWNKNHKDVKLIVAVPSEFFEADREVISAAPVLENTDYQVSWNGFFTNIIQDKLDNRECENTLRQGEAISTIASNYGFDYPADKFEKLWSLLLANQFHDLMAGTTVDAGRPNMVKRFNFVKEKGALLTLQGTKYIADQIDTSSGAPKDALMAMVFFNTLASPRQALINFRWTTGPMKIVDDTNTEIPYQDVGDEKLFRTQLPAMGWRTYYVIKVEPETFSPAEVSIKSDFSTDMVFSPVHGKLSVAFDDQLNIVSLTGVKSAWGMAVREKPLNILCLQPDTGDTYSYVPVESDNFDPTPDRVCSDHKKFFDEYEVVKGPIATRIIVSGMVGESSISREARIYNDIPRIDFITNIDWKEKNRDLHAVFPFSFDGVRTDSVPLGFIQRETDGRFPVQNWFDYGNDETGMTILVHGLSGLYKKGNTLYLGLLRSVSRIHNVPMQSAYSHGQYALRYSIVPRAGKLFENADPYVMGQQFNDIPLVVATDIHEGKLPGEYSLFEAPDGVAATALFKESGKTILRLLETKGKSGKAEIDLNKSFWTGVSAVDFMNENFVGTDFRGGVLNIELTPQKALTFELQ